MYLNRDSARQAVGDTVVECHHVEPRDNERMFPGLLVAQHDDFADKVTVNPIRVEGIAMRVFQQRGQAVRRSSQDFCVLRVDENFIVGL